MAIARVAAQVGSGLVNAPISTLDVTYPVTPSIGDVIGIAVTQGTGLTVTISDNASVPNTYTGITTLTNDGAVASSRVFYTRIATITSLTKFTITFSASSPFYIYAFQGYSGVVASGDPRDPPTSNGAASATATGTTADSTATATATSVANTGLFGWAFNVSGSALTQPASWSLLTSPSTGVSLADRLTNTSGTAYNYAPTQANVTYHSHIVQFLPATAATALPPGLGPVVQMAEVNHAATLAAMMR